MLSASCHRISTRYNSWPVCHALLSSHPFIDLRRATAKTARGSSSNNVSSLLAIAPTCMDSELECSTHRLHRKEDLNAA